MNIVFITVLSLCSAIQALVVMAWALSFMRPISSISTVVLPEWQYLLKPEWEMVEFRWVIIIAVMVQAYLIYRFKSRINDHQLKSFLSKVMITEVLLTALILSACFKMIIYATYPQLASFALSILLILSVIHKIIPRQVHAHVSQWGAWVVAPTHIIRLQRWFTIAMPCLIVGILYVPNITGAMARFFIGEQFHHNDSFIFGPAWAYVSGCRLNIDVISQYGVGLPIVITTLAKIFGKFSYEHIVMSMLTMIMAYYLIWTWLLNRWLKQPILVCAVMLYAIKIQVFNNGVYPFSLTYGSATVLRFWWDSLFFVALWMHISTQQRRWIIAAALASGIQLFYLTSEGVYLYAALGAYLLLYVLRPSETMHFSLLNRLLTSFVTGILPLGIALGLAYCFIGPDVVHAQFWNNMGEFIQYFLSGFGVTPIYQSLLDKEFLASVMGFVVPLVYVMTLLIVGSLWWTRRIAYRHVFVMILSIYGLALYHYYVARSAASSYYVVALPFAFIVGFWADVMLKRISDARRHMIMLALVVGSAYALITNHLFLIYPNIFNTLKNPYVEGTQRSPLKDHKPYFNHLWHEFSNELKVPQNSLGKTDEQLMTESDFKTDKALIDYYNDAINFKTDVDLIQKLTSVHDAVPLISSFEIQLLMQANRKPFFYYFPLVISRPMPMRNFVRTSIYTTDQLKKTINKIQTARPPYIFMEKIFLQRPVPDYFYGQYSSFMYLRDYVLSNYKPMEEGRYLVALKRNGS